MLERMNKIVKVMWMRRGIEAIERESARREGIRQGLKKVKKVMERVEKRKGMARWKEWGWERRIEECGRVIERVKAKKEAEKKCEKNKMLTMIKCFNALKELVIHSRRI
jgi:hypothetical protein